MAIRDIRLSWPKCNEALVFEREELLSDFGSMSPAAIKRAFELGLEPSSGLRLELRKPYKIIEVFLFAGLLYNSLGFRNCVVIDTEGGVCGAGSLIERRRIK